MKRRSDKFKQNFYSKTVPVISFFFLFSFIVSCKFDKILQPDHALPGEIIDIAITVSDNVVPEPNAHKGLLCILVPWDWKFVSATYSGSPGAGVLEESAAWADSVESCYPAIGFGKGMKWIALLSDKGYSYTQPIVIDVAVKLEVGQEKGCFDLAYLVTKATEGLLCTSWTPLSYPHRIGVPDVCDPEDSFRSESSPEWDNLLDRQSGWTGSDGIYSIPQRRSRKKVTGIGSWTGSVSGIPSMYLLFGWIIALIHSR